MSGFRKGKAAIPPKAKRPWERTYRTLTALRAKMPVRKALGHEPGTVAEMTTFKAKPGPGGKRNRARRRAAGVQS